MWAVDSVVQGSDEETVPSVTLKLADNASTMGEWPHAFEMKLTVALVGPSLDIQLAVMNTGDGDFSFTTALHTYLGVRDIRSTQLQGLR